MKKTSRLWLLALALALACACLPLAAFAAGTQGAQNASAAGYTFAATKISMLATPKLSKVENVAGGIKVTWGKVSGAAKYRVFGKSGNGSWKTVADTTATSYTWKKGKSGVKYTFTVRCLSADGKKYTSAYDTAGKAITYIAAPKLTKVENTGSGIKVTWGKVAGAARYRVFGKTSGGSWKTVADTTGTSYTWTKGKNGVKYTFTVRCLSKDGKSYTSGYDAAGKSITYKKQATTLATPKISKVENVAAGVKVTWGKVSGAAKYRVFGKTSGGSWKTVADTTSTSYTWKKGKSGTKYTFTVRCLSADGKSYTSAYDTAGKSITYIAAPAITKLESTATGVKVTWGKVAGAAKYRVFGKTSGGGWKTVADTTATSYTWTKAKSGTKYTFTVRCLSKDSKSYTSAFDTAGKAITYKKPASGSTTGSSTGADANGNVAVIAANFPDSAFRSFVSDNFDTDGNGKLSVAERNAVTEIHVGISPKLDDFGPIVSLQGIEYFPNLAWLNCNQNQVRSLDVSKNTALTFLSCSLNQLTELDVSKNTALEQLSCTDNQLPSLDVSRNKNLKELFCSNNELGKLDVRQNTQLEYLSCNNNDLTELDLSQNPNLNTLYCSGNQLTTLDVRNNPKLDWLYPDNDVTVIKPR